MGNFLHKDIPRYCFKNENKEIIPLRQAKKNRNLKSQSYLIKKMSKLQLADKKEFWIRKRPLTLSYLQKNLLARLI